MAHVGEASRVDALFECVGNLLADDDATKRHVARVDTLCETDEVGRDVPLVDREPLTATAEAGHHFVAHHDDAVLGAQITHTLQVALGRHQNAIRADDGFEPDHCHGVRTFHHQHIFEVLQRALTLFLFIRRVECRAIRVGPPELHRA